MTKSSSTAAVWGLSEEVRRARTHRSDPIDPVGSPLHLFSLEEGIRGQDRKGKDRKEKAPRLKAAAGRWGKRAFNKISWVDGVWDKCSFKIPEEPSAAGWGRGGSSGSDAPIDATSGVIWNIVFKAADIWEYLSAHTVLCSTFKVYFLLMLLLMCRSRRNPWFYIVHQYVM